MLRVPRACGRVAAVPKEDSACLERGAGAPQASFFPPAAAAVWCRGMACAALAWRRTEAAAAPPPGVWRLPCHVITKWAALSAPRSHRNWRTRSLLSSPLLASRSLWSLTFLACAPIPLLSFGSACSILKKMPAGGRGPELLVVDCYNSDGGGSGGALGNCLHRRRFNHL